MCRYINQFEIEIFFFFFFLSIFSESFCFPFELL